MFPVGHGGQILVSATTAALVSGVDLQDLGEHQLRDLTGVEHLFQIRAAGLATDFSRLRTVDAVPGNLPMQATSFVGRAVEVDELVGLVRSHRLVTLTGVGGVGKTRLAVQVAAELVPDFGDGVWLVELAPVGDPAAVPDAVATGLGITQQPGRTVSESVAEALAGRRLLIVVDNCEHVLDAAADLVEAILAQASLQRFEPVGWAEELLPAAIAADVAYLPRLYLAAGLCLYTGRSDEAVTYLERAIELEQDPRYDPFEHGWGQALEVGAHGFAGRIDRFVEITTDLAAETDSELAHVIGLCGLTYMLPAVGRAAEARAIADETVASARAYGLPMNIAYALAGYGRAFAEADPARALDIYREGLEYCRQHRILQFEGVIAREAAGLEAVHGQLEHGLTLFDSTIDSFHQAGDVANVAATLANLATFFDRYEQPEIAATIYGSITAYKSTVMVAGLPATIEHLRSVLSESRFDECVAAGMAMELAQAVQYAHRQIQLTRLQLDEGHITHVARIP